MSCDDIDTIKKCGTEGQKTPKPTELKPKGSGSQEKRVETNPPAGQQASFTGFIHETVHFYCPIFFVGLCATNQPGPLPRAMGLLEGNGTLASPCVGSRPPLNIFQEIGKDAARGRAAEGIWRRWEGGRETGMSEEGMARLSDIAANEVIECLDRFDRSRCLRTTCARTSRSASTSKWMRVRPRAIQSLKMARSSCARASTYTITPSSFCNWETPR